MNHVYAARRSFSLIAIFLLFSTVVFSNTYTVTNTNATGPGSLDQAIQDANTNPGPDVIDFNIPSGPFVIQPAFPGLPSITDAVTINGYTQPGAAQGPIQSRTIQIVLDGSIVGFSNASGLVVSSNNVTIAGLDIINWPSHGISVPAGASNIFIWGNFIGVDAAGTGDAGNGLNGISLGDGGPGGSTGVTIGTNTDGTADTDEGNLIGGNGQDGILGWALSNSVISGNFIGSDKDAVGTILGNDRNGILLTVGSNNNRIGTNGDNSSNDVQELNGIVLNGGRGILIAANSNGNVIAGNFIGVDINLAAAGNFSHGVEIINSSNTRIGINVADADFTGESNIISSNQGNGIQITSQNFAGNTDPNTNNTISGNFIGTTPTNLNRGNLGNGITLSAFAGVTNTNHTIGSNDDGLGDAAEGNVIAYNGIFGIAPDPSTDISGIRMSMNSIYQNTGLGIDLGGDGVTGNDDGDPDTGPNTLYNFPIITNSNSDGTTLTITGISRPGEMIEVYVDDGSGSGRSFLFRAQEGSGADLASGTSSYSDPVFAPGGITDNNFQFAIDRTTMPFFFPGTRFVALGIDAAGNTSEFGNSIILTPVTLTSFKGQLVDGVVKLSWTTSREINSKQFVIEKSLDGVGYTAIGQVNSGSANGQYSFTDATPLGKSNYYRLKQVDQDGNFTYSKALLIRNDVESLVVKISPNPVSTFLNVSFKLDKDETVKLNIYDQMGRVTRRYTLQGSRGINVFNISDLNSLAAGNYVVELKGETIVARQKLVKN